MSGQALNTLISFNVRGLNNDKKRKAIFTYLQKHKGDIIFLQETYSLEKVSSKWLKEWGGGGVMSHGTNHSRGLAI